jgi:hypothetical protein
MIFGHLPGKLDESYEKENEFFFRDLNPALPKYKRHYLG